MKNLVPVYSIGHFINQSTNRTAFEINLFAGMEEPDVEDVHKHSFYEILWVDEGKSKQTIDFQTYELQPKSLFFISPGQVHEFGEWHRLKGGTIMFTEDYFLPNQQNRDNLFELSFLDNVYFNPAILLNCDDFNSFRNYIDLLLFEKNRPEPIDEIVQSLLRILLLQVQRSIKPAGGNQWTKRSIILFKQFKNLLENKFTEALTVGNYAEQLNITQHHLNRVVKEVTGRSTGEVIKGRKILEAKRLLSYTNDPVSEISTQLNYFDSSYFSKLFKTAVGRTPLEFRMEMSKNYRKKHESL
jgi:AraC family transcriptional activator of pobA